MKTVLSKLDYSSEWAPTGVYRDGRPEYRKELSLIVYGNATETFAHNASYQMIKVGEDSYQDTDIGRFNNGFVLGSSVIFLAWIGQDKTRFAVDHTHSGTAHVVLYGW